jgi:hypothetical protein
MPTRRTALSVIASSTLALAGCTDSSEGTDNEFGLTTTGTAGTPGQAVAVEVQSRGVGVITYRVEALPNKWQVTQGDFNPQPTSIRESYPPELVWEPAIGSVSGSFIVSIPDTAPPGEYTLPVEARAADSDESAVSTAIITVEGETQNRTSEKQTTARSTGEQTTTRAGGGQTTTRSAQTESGR